jgi:hypothetical protein
MPEFIHQGNTRVPWLWSRAMRQMFQVSVGAQYILSAPVTNRNRAKKVKGEDIFDPDVVAAVDAKLRALGVDDDPPTSEPEAV